MSCLSTPLSALFSYLCLALLLSMPSPHTSVWLSTPLSVLPSYLCLAPLNALPLPGSPLLSVSSPHTSAWLSTPLRVLPSYSAWLSTLLLCLLLEITTVLMICIRRKAPVNLVLVPGTLVCLCYNKYMLFVICTFLRTLCHQNSYSCCFLSNVSSRFC